jgi:hypothetical protein
MKGTSARQIDRIGGSIVLLALAVDIIILRRSSWGWASIIELTLVVLFCCGIIFGKYWAFGGVSLWFVLSLVGAVFLLPFDFGLGWIGWLYVLIYVSAGSWCLYRFLMETRRAQRARAGANIGNGT